MAAQQQVVNPFFKGSVGTVRFGTARAKGIPSGGFVLRCRWLARGPFLSFPLEASQPTFARFPITPFPSPFPTSWRKRIPRALEVRWAPKLGKDSFSNWNRIFLSVSQLCSYVKSLVIGSNSKRVQVSDDRRVVNFSRETFSSPRIHYLVHL